MVEQEEMGVVLMTHPALRELLALVVKGHIWAVEGLPELRVMMQDWGSTKSKGGVLAEDLVKQADMLSPVGKVMLVRTSPY